MIQPTLYCISHWCESQSETYELDLRLVFYLDSHSLATLAVIKLINFIPCRIVEEQVISAQN